MGAYSDQLALKPNLSEAMANAIRMRMARQQQSQASQDAFEAQTHAEDRQTRQDMATQRNQDRTHSLAVQGQEAEHTAGAEKQKANMLRFYADAARKNANNPDVLAKIQAGAAANGIDLTDAFNAEAQASRVLGVREEAKPPEAPRDARSNEIELGLGLDRTTPAGREEYERRRVADAKAAVAEAKRTASDSSARAAMGTTDALRKEFQSLQAYKDTKTVDTGMEKINAASSTGAGDIALIFNYMKLLDPSSTVRESEFEMAAKSGGVPGVIGSYYSKIKGDGQLKDDVRANIRSEAAELQKAQQRIYKKEAARYRKLAEKAGVDPSNVAVLDQQDEPRGAPSAADIDAEIKAIENGGAP